MSTAIAGPPVQDLVEGGTWALRHVYPVLPWFSAAVLTTPGVIRYYRLNETAGVNAADAVAGQTGTYTNSPTLAAAALWTPDDATNTAVTFASGSTHYVAVPTIDFATAVKSFSVEAIFRPTNVAGGTRALFSAFGANVAGQIMVVGVDTNGAIGFSWSGSFNFTGPAVIVDNAPYHAVFTYDAATDTCTVYVNGVLAISNNTGPYTGTATPTCRIGGDAGSTGWTGWTGTIDEVAIYARALSAAEVLAHAEAAGLAPSSTVNGGAVKRSSTLILGKPYGATVVPVSTTPGSPDFAQGSYTHRLDDAGELDLMFPNGVSSDGILWRERFSPSMHREWLEVYRGPIADASRLEFVANIESANVDRGAVQVKGHDAFALLKKAYETDREWTAAPRDVVEAYGRVPVPYLADDFDGSTLSPTWRIGETTATATVSGSVVTLSSGSADATATWYAPGAVYTTDWRLVVNFRSVAGGGTKVQILSASGIVIFEAVATTTSTIVATAYDTAGANGIAATLTIPSFSELIGLLPATLTIERKGRWVTVFVNDRFIGVLPWQAGNAHAVRLVAFFFIIVNAFIQVDGVTWRAITPFLQRGATTGDKHLPGTYPPRGLHGRYWNNADLQGVTALERRNRVFTPGRPIGNDRLDTVAGVATSPQNFPADYVSARFFGAVYLRGTLGDYQFRATGVIGGIRVWVADTDFGDQVLDDWTVAGTRTVGPATVPSTIFGSRDAWVPIVVEFHDDAQVQAAALEFQPPGAGTYTDPGGGTITRGAFAAIPSTSLSPLGCFDNRVQGASHYDLVKQAADAFGLHLWLEPMQLESGEFPGRLTARERWGRDTDVQLRSEDLDVADPLLSPSIETDSSDVATTLRGSGAGLADGRGSQVTAEITDAAAATFALFDLQAVSDAGDIVFRDLLAARLDAELGLRNTEWTNITGQPRGRERLADTWPLTSTYSAMRWRPGDAVRLSIPDIGVDDTAPRQVLQVTREIVPEGLASCQVAFRQRPRGPAAAIRKATRQALLPRRVYQRQKVSLDSFFFANGVTTAAGAFTTYLVFGVMPGDTIVKATARISRNDAAVSVGMEVNGVSRTTALGGGWTLSPVDVDVTAFCTPAGAADNRFYIRLQNNGGVASLIEFGVIVEVLR